MYIIWKNFIGICLQKIILVLLTKEIMLLHFYLIMKQKYLSFALQPAMFVCVCVYFHDCYSYC